MANFRFQSNDGTDIVLLYRMQNSWIGPVRNRLLDVFIMSQNFVHFVLDLMDIFLYAIGRRKTNTVSNNP